MTTAAPAAPDAKEVETQHRNTQVPEIPKEEPVAEPKSRRDRGLERAFGTLHKFMANQEKFNNEIVTRLESGSIKQEAAADPKPTLDSAGGPEKLGEELAAWSVRDGARKAKAKEHEDRKKNPPASGPLPPEVRAQVLSEKIGVDEEVALDFLEQQEDAKEVYPDFDKVVNNKDIPSSDILNKCIVESEHGAKIQYHLGKNKDKAEALAKITRTRDVVAELKKLEEELSSEEPPSKEDDKAPITPVGSQRGANRKAPEKMPDGDYFAMRQAEINKTRRFN